MTVAPTASIFPDIANVRRVNVYRGTQLVRTYASETSVEAIRRNLYDEHEYGDFVLKPATHVGPLAEPNLPLRVDPPPTDALALDAALERATLERAQERLDRASSAEIDARSRAAEATYSLRIAKAEGEAMQARMELEQVSEELTRLRQSMNLRMENQRAQLEEDAERRARRLKDDAEIDAARAKMRLEAVEQRAANELAYVRQTLQAQLDAANAELSKERAERQQATRLLEKERELAAQAQRDHQDELFKLRAKLANNTNPGVQRVQEMAELAKVVSSATDEGTKTVMLGLLSAEAGVAPPSKTDQVLEMIVNNPHMQELFGRALEKMFADKTDKPTPALLERSDV